MTEEMKAQDSPGGDPSKPGGIFITKGMVVSIPPGGLTLRATDEGEIKADPLVVEVSQDVSQFWIGIAVDHLIAARGLHEKVLEARAVAEDDNLARALEEESTACMQAIVAAAIAVDALYAMVQRHVDLPEDLKDRWRNNRTARYKQVAEVFRRAFNLSSNGVTWAKTLLKDIYRFRDLAVHPGAQPQKPVWYQELKLGVEWRFESFRFDNAKLLVGAALGLLCQLTERRELKPEGLEKFSKAARARYQPALAEWTQEFGQLYERQSS